MKSQVRRSHTQVMEWTSCDIITRNRIFTPVLLEGLYNFEKQTNM